MGLYALLVCMNRAGRDLRHIDNKASPLIRHNIDKSQVTTYASSGAVIKSNPQQGVRACPFGGARARTPVGVS